MTDREWRPEKTRTLNGEGCGASGFGSPLLLVVDGVAVIFLPLESVPSVVTVRVLPSAERTMRPVKRTLSPFLTVNVSV